MCALWSCRSDKSYTVIVNDVNGLELGSQVVYEGLPIGRISDMDLYNDSVAVDFILERDIKIPLNSKFHVESRLLGSATLVLEKSNIKSFATAADTFRGSRYMDTAKYSGSDSVRKVKREKALQKIVQGFTELLEASKKDSIK
jgi:hypothetical protein